MKHFTAIIVIIVFSTNCWARRPDVMKKGVLVIGGVVHNLETKSKKTVVNLQGDRIGETTLSPNGEKMVYAQYKGGLEGLEYPESKLKVIDIDGKNEKTLFESKYGFRFCWSPYSKYLFVDYPELKEPNMIGIIINTENTDEVWKVTVGDEILNGGATPYWFRSGDRLFFTSASGIEKVASVNILNFVTNEVKKIGEIEFGLDKVVSPDEKMIAYTKLDQNVYLMDIDGKDYGILKDTKAYEHNIFWSWDSKWVGYWKSRDFLMMQNDLYIRNIDTKKEFRLLGFKGGYANQWFVVQKDGAPDVSKILERSPALIKIDKK